MCLLEWPHAILENLSFWITATEYIHVTMLKFVLSPKIAEAIVLSIQIFILDIFLRLLDERTCKNARRLKAHAILLMIKVGGNERRQNSNLPSRINILMAPQKSHYSKRKPPSRLRPRLFNLSYSNTDPGCFVCNSHEPQAAESIEETPIKMSCHRAKPVIGSLTIPINILTFMLCHASFHLPHS